MQERQTQKAARSAAAGAPPQRLFIFLQGDNLTCICADLACIRHPSEIAHINGCFLYDKGKWITEAVPDCGYRAPLGSDNPPTIARAESMGKTREKAPSVKRKGKHSNDANRSNKGNKDGVRDAATVREIKHCRLNS